ncbi:MAG: transketolase [Thermodesulfobacteriota bacterium]
MTVQDMDTLCINTIRALCMDAVQKADSGHPGAPLGMAPAAYVLFTKVMKHNPRRPDWPDRDRFVLSAGHASILLYSLLHCTGYDVSLNDLKEFRQWGSKTPGHPEYGHTPGVETTTGPLGQGFANAVGMAMAERFLAATFNLPGHTVVDHRTYVLCGDGDLMEGVCAEAASLAGHLGLSKLICLYDDNKISIEGPTSLTFTEDVAKRFEAYGWNVLCVEDGNDPGAIGKAVNEAQKETVRPTLIRVATQIAFGSPNKQGSASAHGAPLGAEEVRLTKANLGCPDRDFCVPDAALEHFRQSLAEGDKAQRRWHEALLRYQEDHPDLFRELKALLDGTLPAGWDSRIPEFPAGGSIATRAASGKVLNAIAQEFPTLLGGSADLAPSNNTLISGAGDFSRSTFSGRNIRFGVREHSMGAIANGMALHKGLRPFCGTFLVFADYMRPAIRMAALMKLPVTYVFTHDSVAVGEDGPTHQPVEHLASLRVIPGLTVIRPADANETAEAWRQAMITKGPVALILSRQNLPVLDRERFAGASGVARGAYVLTDVDGDPDLILIATGSEVHPALAARMRLMEKGLAARVVSMPSREIFSRQPEAYQKNVLLPSVSRRLVIEAASPFGWESIAGNNGKIIGINGFGISAPGSLVMERMGFTVDDIVSEALELFGPVAAARKAS